MLMSPLPAEHIWTNHRLQCKHCYSLGAPSTCKHILHTHGHKLVGTLTHSCQDYSSAMLKQD